MITIKPLEDYAAGGDDVSSMFASTLIDGAEVPLYITVLSRRQEMRLDTISMDLYGSMDYIDVIMDMNGIVNPFSVTEGMVIVYTEPDSVPALLDNRQQLEDMRNALVDASKGHRTDPSRTEYLRNRTALEKEKNTLPPTILQAGVKTVVQEDGYIKLLPSF